jgi:hypothetical protein
MGSITRSLANNITTGGVILPAGITNSSVSAVTSFVNASSGTLILLSTQTASASVSISFTTGLDSTYDEYIFKFINIHPAIASLLTFQGSTNGGSTYNTTMTTTTFDAYHNESDTGTAIRYTTGYDQAQGTSFQSITDDEFDTSNNDHSANGYLQLFNPSSTTYVKHYISCTAHVAGEYGINTFSAGYFNTTSAINAIQFKMSNSSNMDEGIIKMYGVKKS